MRNSIKEKQNEKRKKKDKNNNNMSDIPRQRKIKQNKF